MFVDHSPRNVGKLLDDSVSLYKARFRTLVPAAAALLFPVGLLQGIAYTLYIRSLVTLPFLQLSAQPTLPAEFFWMYGAAIAVSAASLPVYGASIWYLSALMAAAPALERGAAMTPREFLAAGRDRFPHLLLALFVSYVIVQIAVVVPYALGVVVFPLFPLMLLVVLAASVTFTAMLSFVPGVTVVEGAPLDRALQRSMRLALSDFKRVLVFLIAFGVVWTGLRAAITSPAALAHGISLALTRPDAQFTAVSWFWAGVQGLFQAIALTLTVPLAHIVFYEFYIDMRARSEGLDLIERARRLAA